MADVTGYTINNLHGILHDDPWAARNEAERRHAVLTKKIQAAEAKISAMHKERTEYVELHTAALTAIRAAQSAA